MSTPGNRLLQIFLLAAIMTVTGCATNQQGYQKAFDNQHSLTQNQCALTQSCDDKSCTEYGG
jgi:uncharacterized lipoprotein YajG